MPAVDLLIVDDEASLRDFLTIVFEEEGWRVESAASLADGRAAVLKKEPDVVLCDLMLPDGSGIDYLREVKAQNPSIAFIMITAYTSTKSAVEALKAGAVDYIAKPFDVEELKIIVRKASERKELEDENLHLRTALEERFTFSNIIGKSPKMQEIFSIVQRIAKTTSTVLISGESGTGKELIARAIHYNSGRRGKFVSINCGALPETLLESELFGTSAAHSPARSAKSADSFTRRSAARSSSTRSARRRPRCRSSCCAYCRIASCGASVRPSRRRSTCA